MDKPDTEMVLLVEPAGRLPHVRVIKEKHRAYLTAKDESVAVNLPQPWVGYVILVCACAGCSSTSTFERLLPAEVPGPLRSFWRQTTTSGMLLIVEVLRVALFLKGERRRRKMDPGTILVVIAGFALQAVCICVSLLYIPTTMCLVLVNAAPVWLVLGGLLTRQTQHPLVVFGAGLGFVGAVILCVDELTSQTTDLPRSPPRVGVIIATIGGIGGAAYVAAAKRCSGVLAPTRLMLLANVGAALVSFFIVGIFGSAKSFFDPTTGLFGFAGSQTNLIESLLLSFFVDGVGVVGICLALQFLDPIVVAVAIQCEPIAADVIDAIYGVGTLNDMNPPTLLASAIVVSGCALVVAVNALSTTTTTTTTTTTSSGGGAIGDPLLVAAAQKAKAIAKGAVDSYGTSSVLIVEVAQTDNLV